MPKIPVYNRQVQEQSQAIRPANVSINVPRETSVEAAVAQGISNVLGKVSEVMQYKKDRDDKQKVLDIDTQFTKDLQDTLYSGETENIKNDNGTITPRPVGLLNRKLKQANNTSTDYEDSINKLKNKYLKGQPKEISQVLDNMFNQKYLSARDTVIKHETLQNNNDKDISLKANLEVIKNNAVLNPSSDNINQVITTGKGKILVNNDGVYPKEYTELQMQQFGDEVITGSVSSLLTNIDYTQAKVVLETNKDNISGKTYAILNGKINAGKYIELARSISNSGLSYEDQLKEADKITEPVVSKKVRNEIKMRFEEQEAIAKLNKTKYEDGQWDNMFNDPMNYNLHGQIGKVDDDTYEALEKYKASYVKGLNGDTGDIGWDSYAKYKSMQVSELKNVPVSEVVESIKDKAMTKEIIGLMSDAKTGKSDDAFRSRSFYQQGMQFVKDNGVKEEQSQMFFEQYSRHIDAIPEDKRDEKTVGDLNRQLMEKVQVGRNWWFGVSGGNVRRYEIPYLNSEKEANYYLKNRPDNLLEIDDIKWDKEKRLYYQETTGVIFYWSLDGKQEIRRRNNA